MDTTRGVLLGIFERLLSSYGPQGWWPAESAFEVCVGAILTQSTSWSNVEKSIKELDGAGLLSPEGLMSVPESRLSGLVRSSLYHNVKAGKLKAFVGFLFREYDGSLEKLFSLPKDGLRQALLGVWGVGPETADSIILYAAGKPSFVVDAYTRRIFERVGFLNGSESYDDVKAFFEGNLPVDAQLFNEFHALIVEHAKRHCKKKPVCAGCPVIDYCKAGRSLN